MSKTISERTYQTQEALRREDRLCAWHPSKPHRATLNVSQEITSGPGTGEAVEMKLCAKHAAKVGDSGSNYRTVGAVTIPED